MSDSFAPQQLSFETHILPQTPFLKKLARRLARPPLEPDDLVQDALLRAWKYWGTFRHDANSNCQAWLIRILTNVMRSHCAKSRRAAPPPELSVHAPHFAAGRRSAFDVNEALGALSAPNRAVMKMVAIEGRSYAEVAVALGVPIGTVMSRLHRSRRKLAAEMAGDPRRCG
jgi:RNA polymerase sigma-70 factor (ECF subfamily)